MSKLEITTKENNPLKIPTVKTQLQTIANLESRKIAKLAILGNLDFDVLEILVELKKKPNAIEMLKENWNLL